MRVKRLTTGLFARYSSAPMAIQQKAALAYQRENATADYASKATDMRCRCKCVLVFQDTDYVALGSAVKEELFLR